MYLCAMGKYLRDPLLLAMLCLGFQSLFVSECLAQQRRLSQIDFAGGPEKPAKKPAEKIEQPFKVGEERPYIENKPASGSDSNLADREKQRQEAEARSERMKAYDAEEQRIKNARRSERLARKSIDDAAKAEKKHFDEVCGLGGSGDRRTCAGASEAIEESAKQRKAEYTEDRKAREDNRKR